MFVDRRKYGRTFETHFIRSTRRSPPTNAANGGRACCVVGAAWFINRTRLKTKMKVFERKIGISTTVWKKWKWSVNKPLLVSTGSTIRKLVQTVGSSSNYLAAPDLFRLWPVSWRRPQLCPGSGSVKNVRYGLLGLALTKTTSVSKLLMETSISH